MKVCIIVPAYNEEKRIGKMLKTYGDYFDFLVKKGVLEYEMLVVINGTHDRTEDIVISNKKKNERISYLNLVKNGKGYAIIEGFKHTLKNDAEAIGFVDADMATPPEAFYELIKNLGKNDGIIASRWRNDSMIKTKQNILSRINSRGFNFLVRSILFLNFSDTQCGAKLFTKEALEKIIKDIGFSKWAFDIELLYLLKDKGYKIKEIGTIWEDKKGSTIDNVRTPVQMFLSIIRLRLLNSYFKFIIRAYDKMPEIIKIHRSF